MKALLQNPDAWSAIAADYDVVGRRLLTPFSVEAVRWAEIGTDDDVLDVASGPGTTTLLAARVARSVQAVDFSAGMIDHLRRHAADLGNVSAMVGDGQDLSFEDDRFSAAFSMFGLMFFADPIAGLRQLHRVLRPGGRVVISSWVSPMNSPKMQPLVAAIMAAVPPDPNQKQTPFAFRNTETLRQGLQAGGFKNIRVQQFAPSFAVVDAETYWSEARGNIMVTHLREKLGDAWPETEAKILAHLTDSLRGVERLEMPSLMAMGWK